MGLDFWFFKMGFCGMTIILSRLNFFVFLRDISGGDLYGSSIDREGKWVVGFLIGLRWEEKGRENRD